MDEALARLRELKEEFDACHRDGMAALANGDYAALEAAIRAEAAIIAEQRTLLKSLRPLPLDSETKDHQKVPTSR